MTDILTRVIYTLEAGAIGRREGTITLDPAEVIVDEDDTQRPMSVSGLGEYDLALRLDVPVTDPETHDIKWFDIGFLVTHYRDGDGIIVPGEKADYAPKDWSSPYLHKLVDSLEPGEFEQLTLYNLAAYITSNCAYRQPGPPPDPLVPMRLV